MKTAGRRTSGVFACLCMWTCFAGWLGSGCGEPSGGVPHLTGFRTEADKFYPWGRPALYELRGEVDFFDPDGDVILLRAWKPDCGAGDGLSLEWTTWSLEGLSHGAIPFLLPFSGECPPGDYQAYLHVVDLGGNRSNEVAVPFRICADFFCL